MKDTNTNSIIKDVYLKHKIYIKDIFLKNKIYIASYAVQIVENSFTWYGHERYTHTMIMQNEIFFMKSLIKSYMESNKCRNVL